MPKNKWIKKVAVIGSGPIIIGQAAEFDYAGTQACKALREEGIEVVLINSNPATIMTDQMMADKIYIEPLTKESVSVILKKERPDAILPTLGGQTGLNLAMELYEEGFFEENNITLLGANPETIKKAEDRLEFKKTMEKINEPCIVSEVVESIKDAVTFAKKNSYPVIVRPAYTLGGTGGGIAHSEEELRDIAKNGLHLSRVHQILIEKDISGWKEIEYEVMRDGAGNVITVCNMENIDPVGVHTGDSIVVAPSQTLRDKEYQMLRTSALKIITELKIEGGCNVQFALNPLDLSYAVIEVNPRVSRSSALASKATGYPIAKVATKIAIGYRLDEIKNAVTGKTCACFEPTLDYLVVKFPKWPFDKFVFAKRNLGTQMKATGEVMAIGNSFESAIMKAIRGVDAKFELFLLPEFQKLSNNEIVSRLSNIDDKRIFAVVEAIRRGISFDEIYNITKIDKWFLAKLRSIVWTENSLKTEEMTASAYLAAKKKGFTDSAIKTLSHADIEKWKRCAVYKTVDTCAAEFEAETPYYYSSFDEENESIASSKKKVVVFGSGPIRIGQGIEFDYASVHSVWSLKKHGYETIIINNNPETVSTDFDTADKLYFEPLTKEDVHDILENEKPDGVIVQFGGQTAISLAQYMEEMNVPILGTALADIDAAEDREKFDEILEQTKIPRPDGKTVYTLEEALFVAETLGYPVLIRPSYVLGGQGMVIAADEGDIRLFMGMITENTLEHPVLIDKYMMGKEAEIDAISDGEDILIPGIMEHLERAGVHSGDSISVYPPKTILPKHKEIMAEYAKRLASALHVKGIINIQFVIYNDEVYVIEVNPRSSRTVPYLSKVTGVPMIELATKCILGEKLKDMGYGTGLYPEKNYYAVKVPVFSFAKIHDADTHLGPEMKSTGEVLGIDKSFEAALMKGLLAAGFSFTNKKKGGVLFTLKDADKYEFLSAAEKFKELGFTIYATAGTYKVLSEHEIDAVAVNRSYEPEPNIMTVLESGEIDYVVSTSAHGKDPKKEGVKIRRKSVERSIICLTSADTVAALLKCLKSGIHEETLVPVDINTL